MSHEHRSAGFPGKTVLGVSFGLLLSFTAAAQTAATPASSAASASSSDDVGKNVRLILERLERIEQENRNLAAEVRALRQQLENGATRSPVAESENALTEAQNDTPLPPLAERVATQEQRVNDLAQSKVEASQKFPIKLTGMLLFNAFLNGRANGGAQDPTVAATADSNNAGGASVTQSLIGFLWDGPRLWGGGKVNGFLNLDLSGGPASPVNHLVRLHTAGVTIDWKNRSLTLAQDKPIFSPREPTSLAQVAVSPLTAAGNPWLWQPQVRFEQRFTLGDNTGLRAQAGVYETAEPTTDGGPQYASAVAAARPGFEGRFELWRNFLSNARVEIAPGFHLSQTHVDGFSIASRLFSVDWMIQPLARVKITGLFYQGSNLGGFGGLRQGFTLRDKYAFIAIPSAGGWLQFSYQATSRLGFNVYGGQEGYAARDLLAAAVNRNLSYAGNAIFRLAPNILVSVEASQVRTKYLYRPSRSNNHYDLALAYLF